MSAFSIFKGAVMNFQPTNSVLAGGAASVLVYAIGACLVAGGVSIPYIGVPTMAMVGLASPVIGHVVSAFVPDSDKQLVSGLANKLRISVTDIRNVLPQFEDSFPGDVKPSGTVTNLKLKT